jgi:hypothetical protein
MSYAKLNIWLRYADCRLITDCWRTDLVINSCCDEPVVNQDPTIIEKLKERYPDYNTVKVHEYPSDPKLKETRICLIPGNGGHVYHIEVDVPPGCYVVWTRVCYRGNEETNKVMVIVSCGDEACVNLILNDLYICTNAVFYPFLERAVDLKVPKHDLQAVARVMMAVGEKQKKDVIAALSQRLQEAKDMKEMQLEKAIDTLIGAVKGIDDPQQQRQQ